MRNDIHCPKDIGFNNIFSGEDCEKEQYYNNCYHCWTSSIADAFQKKRGTAHWIQPKQDDGMSDPIFYQVRCSKCGFDLDPQTWYEELKQYGADKFCPKCGASMTESENKCEKCEYYINPDYTRCHTCKAESEGK